MSGDAERVVSEIDDALADCVSWSGSDDAASWEAGGGHQDIERRRLLLHMGDTLRRYALEDGTAPDRCLQCDMGQTIREPRTYGVDGVTCCSACGRRIL